MDLTDSAEDEAFRAELRAWLILDMHQTGVEVRPMRTIDGESHFCEVFLTDARVPVTNRVGDENDGWRVTNVRAYLWSLQYTIAAGTSQIQRNLIAERILGMPRSA